MGAQAYLNGSPGWASNATEQRTTVNQEQAGDLAARLEALRVEHRDLDDAIAQLQEALYVDQLQLRRMKKRKLQLKDFIARMESALIPDLDA